MGIDGSIKDAVLSINICEDGSERLCCSDWCALEVAAEEHLPFDGLKEIGVGDLLLFRVVRLSAGDLAEGPIQFGPRGETAWAGRVIDNDASVL